MEYENKEICSKCKGACCKKSGCDYFVEDFKTINRETIINLLNEGNTSIVATLNFKTNKFGKKYCYPFLYLRTRNKDRDIIDLFSMKKECSILTETGCPYPKEKRPGGGLNLIPDKNFNCKPLKDQRNEILKWEPYQNLLSKIVKRYTNMSVEEKLKHDVENVLYQVITEQFDGIAKNEIIDILSCINEIAICFPEQYKNAKIKEKQNKILIKKE